MLETRRARSGAFLFVLVLATGWLPTGCVTAEQLRTIIGQQTTVAENAGHAALYREVHASVVSIKAVRRGEFARDGQSTSLRALKEQCAQGVDDCLAGLDELAMASHFGSGVFLDDRGLTLTAAHVVADAEMLYLRMAGERTVAAQVLARDARHDLALLIPQQPIQTQAGRIGDSSKLQIGDRVISIGSPFGLAGTVATGIVSGQDRRVGDFDEMPLLQSDVIVNPGNSGGPVFAMDGSVVALTSKLLSTGGGFSGVSFAIPIELAMRIADDLRRFGSSQRGRVGAAFVDVPAELVDIDGLADARGALITAVTADGLFARHGIRAGDIVKSFDGIEVKHAGELSRRIFEIPALRTVTVELIRSGQPIRRTLSN